MQTTHVQITKQLRVELDGTLQKLKHANRCMQDPVFEAEQRASAERTLAMRKIQEAIMWLGMDLKGLKEAGLSDAPSPYPSSYDPRSTVVEPTADGLKL